MGEPMRNSMTFQRKNLSSLTPREFNTSYYSRTVLDPATKDIEFRHLRIDVFHNFTMIWCKAQHSASASSTTSEQYGFGGGLPPHTHSQVELSCSTTHM